MKKEYWKTIGSSMLCLLPLLVQAQHGPNSIEPEKKTKIVRGCLYEVIPGLAEITNISVDKTANESVLNYDEHSIWFKFTRMGKAELLSCLKNKELTFTLRSNRIKIPVGPEYIKAKNLKVGTKYAMNILQTKDKNACLEQYTYESKALNNDLFEAEEQIIPFMKATYTTSSLKDSLTIDLENCLSSNTNTEVVTNYNLAINIDSLKGVIRKEKEAKSLKLKPVRTKSNTGINYVPKAVALQKARQKAKDTARQERLIKQQQRIEDRRKRKALKELRLKLEEEVELEMEQELR